MFLRDVVAFIYIKDLLKGDDILYIEKDQNSRSIIKALINALFGN